MYQNAAIQHIFVETKQVSCMWQKKWLFYHYMWRQWKWHLSYKYGN